MARTERDPLGAVAVPDEALYGAQTARALANFPVSGTRVRPELVRAAGQVKLAAARANVELGELDPDRGTAIAAAAVEVAANALDRHFPLDPFGAGAGTSFNMNANEVIANRALELLGRPRSDHDYLSPNDHVNRGQSSNDAYPTMCHLAALAAAGRLAVTLERLAAAFVRKAAEFGAVRKTGRTHLMDALPVTLGSEFGAWAAAVRRAAGRVAERGDGLLEVALGGTAVGSGANAHPRFRETVLRLLAEVSDLALRPAQDPYEALQSRAQLAAFSGALRELAVELGRIANDIRLLGSGPVAGLGEIELPAVQPGSSMMPGKVNPSLAECLNMVCFQIIGNDTAVALAAGAGQLELNVFAPVMIHNILGSAALLSNFLPVFADRCVDGIGADANRCRRGIELNPSLATLLAPRIGYLRAAELAQAALAAGRPVRALAVEQGLLTVAEADTLFGPEPPRTD